MDDDQQESCPCPGNLSGRFLAACLLLCLSRSSAHGYQLADDLVRSELLSSPPDATSVYRALRRLEQDGLVTSRWVPGEAGPARRLYDLTADGKEFLQVWTAGIRRDRQAFDRFLSLYTQAPGSSAARQPAAGRSDQ